MSTKLFYIACYSDWYLTFIKIFMYNISKFPNAPFPITPSSCMITIAPLYSILATPEILLNTITRRDGVPLVHGPTVSKLTCYPVNN